MTEIKYKDTVIPVEAGQTVTLHTAGKKFTEDIAITAPKESGGGVELIDFSVTFQGRILNYKSEAGMTWEEWVNSWYNPSTWYSPTFKQFWTAGSAVYFNNTGSGVPVQGAEANDAIISGKTYEATSGGGGGSN